MKKISIVILLAIGISLVAADPPPPPRWFFVLFQLGYNDTAYVDTMDICSKCAASFNRNLCTLQVISSMGTDTDSTDDVWYGFSLRFFIYDSSADTIWDSCGIHSCPSASIPLWRVQPCIDHLAPTCSTVWGYHLWIIDIGDSAFPSLTDGDSLCVYITKGSIWGRKCIAYDDLALYQIMRIVLPDTSSLIIEDDKYKRKPRLRYLKGRFDLRGRRLQGTPPTVYIEDGKVKVRLK